MHITIINNISRMFCQEDFNDYDSFVERRSAAKLACPGAANGSHKPRYISNLLRQVEQRKIERDDGYQRKLIAERKGDEGIYHDTLAFITPGYKKRVLERRRREDEERRRDQVNTRNLLCMYQHVFGDLFRNDVTPEEPSLRDDVAPKERVSSKAEMIFAAKTRAIARKRAREVAA